MKITVITDAAGTIVGTASSPIDSELEEEEEEGLVAEPGQSVHVIDLPNELQRIHDVDELHRKLESHLRHGAS